MISWSGNFLTAIVAWRQSLWLFRLPPQVQKVDFLILRGYHGNQVNVSGQ